MHKILYLFNVETPPKGTQATKIIIECCISLYCEHSTSNLEANNKFLALFFTELLRNILLEICIVKNKTLYLFTYGMNSPNSLTPNYQQKWSCTVTTPTM